MLVEFRSCFYAPALCEARDRARSPRDYAKKIRPHASKDAISRHKKWRKTASDSLAVSGDRLRQSAKLIEASRPAFAIHPRIALGGGLQIAEASLFDHVQLNSYRVLSENKPKAMPNSEHVYEVRPRKDRRGAALISDALPFGREWYEQASDANAKVTMPLRLAR